MTGVFDPGHRQAELHAIGQLMYRSRTRGGAELVFHAQVFSGHRQQRLDPLAFRVAVHRLGNGGLQGQRDMVVLAPLRQFFGDFGFQRFRGFTLGHAQVDRQFEVVVVHPDIGQRCGQRPHEVIGETDPQLATQIIQAPVVGCITRSVSDVVVLERNLTFEAVDEVQHARHRVHPGVGFGGVGGNTGYGQHDILADHIGAHLEVVTVALDVFSTGFLQAGSQLGRLVSDKGGD